MLLSSQKGHENQSARTVRWVMPGATFFVQGIIGGRYVSEEFQDEKMDFRVTTDLPVPMIFGADMMQMLGLIDDWSSVLHGRNDKCGDGTTTMKA